MQEGDVVLVSLLASNGKLKKRPALVLKIMPKHKDLLLCGISSQSHQYIKDFDLLIDSNSLDFTISGLVKESIVRLSYLSVLPTSLIEGKIGEISNESHRSLLERLCNYLLN